MLNRIGSICGVVGLVITVIGWLGISPEIVGQRIYDVLYVALPFASGVFGLITGWFLRGLLVDAQAVKAAAIEKARQDGETERLRLEQERIEEEQKTHEREENEQAEAERIRKQQKLEQSRIDLVKHLPFDAKDNMWTLYQKGSIVLSGASNERFFANLGFAAWVDYETIDYGEERWFLKDWAREFLDAHPELLDCAKQAQERREAVDDSIAEHGYQKTVRTAGELYGFEG